jgi:hypothetical protein
MQTIKPKDAKAGMISHLRALKLDLPSRNPSPSRDVAL